MKNETIYLEDTKFIYRTNFAGDPSKDKYGNGARRGNIIIPTQEQAEKIKELGIAVKETKPRDGEEAGFVPTYYMPVIINYTSESGRNRPPKVYLVSGNYGPVLLDEESVGQIDYIYVVGVDATIEIAYLPKYDRHAAYVRTMYVRQDVDEDPFATKYAVE